MSENVPVEAPIRARRVDASMEGGDNGADLGYAVEPFPIRFGLSRQIALKEISRPPMLRRLYKWVLSLSARPTAQIWLAVIAFVESSIFLVPADVLLLPMVLTQPKKAYRYAAIATIASVLGGIAGWALGYFAYETVAKPILSFYGKLAEFEHLKASIDDRWILLMMITSGIAHLPPIKVVTILSGAVHMSLPVFILSATVTRGARFFLFAYLVRRFGETVALFIEQRLNQVVLIVAALAAAAILLSGKFVTI